MNRIDNMTDGQVGYISPWGMYLHDSEFWLIGNVILEKKPESMSELRVYKKDNLYYVDSSLCRYIWDDGEASGNFTPIPVQQMRFSGVILWEK